MLYSQGNKKDVQKPIGEPLGRILRDAIAIVENFYSIWFIFVGGGRKLNFMYPTLT